VLPLLKEVFMSEYKGFRIWNVNFQALEATTSGVTIEYENDGTTPTGRLLKNGAFAGYYPNTQNVDGESLALGVKASLEDTCAPLIDPDVNGVGWSLDTDLYTRLNNLEASAYSQFKEKNPLLWTPDTPTLSNGNSAPKCVRIIPCKYVYAMFFKHTTGHKLMVMLNYAGMHTNLSSYQDNYKLDAGFLRNHIHLSVMNRNSSYAGYSAVGGFILSMMPPSNEDWHPEYSIRDELFYPVSSFHIVSQFSSGIYFSYGSSTPAWKCASWLRVGTDTSTGGSSSTAGILVGTSLKTSILADSKGNIGIGYFYRASSNTMRMNPLMFIGPFYTTMLNSNDTTPHRFLASFGNSLNRYAMEASGSPSYSMNAWQSNSNSSYCVDVSYNNTNYLSFMKSDGDSNYVRAYTAYPAVPSTVYSTYRYSKAAYTIYGLLDSDVLRFVNPDGIISGQTYNDGQWCFIASVASMYASLVAEDGTTASEHLYPVIRWDTEFNGTDTFC
jgi:hypothetical protein